MFITKSTGKQAIWKVVGGITEVENCIFLKSLLGAIIQDSGTRERRMILLSLRSNSQTQKYIYKRVMVYTQAVSII